MPDRTCRVAAALAAAVILGATIFANTSVWAQTSLPANPPAPPTGNAETPLGGIARGVVQPPQVDPQMVTPPPQTANPTMPVIKPPAMAK